MNVVVTIVDECFLCKYENYSVRRDGLLFMHDVFTCLRDDIVYLSQNVLESRLDVSGLQRRSFDEGQSCQRGKKCALVHHDT